MADKKICFRFDVDTHKCAQIGMPNLLDLAARHNVKLTFFVNCGRAIAFWDSLKAMFKSSSHEGTTYPMLGARRKLGNFHFIKCALLNPEIFKSASTVIKRAHVEGHEIGLHGGRNHELWCRNVNIWSVAQIKNEVVWGLEKLAKIGVLPKIFASPCAQGGERVRLAISSFANFDFISDDLDPQSQSPKRVDSGVLDIPTALCGEGGVAYIEQQVALNHNVEQIVDNFKNKLKLSDRIVFYDHPYFAGVEALSIMSRLIECAKQEGFKVCSLQEIGSDFVKVQNNN